MSISFAGPSPFVRAVMQACQWATLRATELVDWSFALRNSALALQWCSFSRTVRIFFFLCSFLPSCRVRDYQEKRCWNESLWDKEVSLLGERCFSKHASSSHRFNMFSCWGCPAWSLAMRRLRITDILSRCRSGRSHNDGLCLLPPYGGWMWRGQAKIWNQLKRMF